MILNYILKNWIEIVGALLSLIYLYLSINQRVSLWFYGIISSLFYIVVFYNSKLYADMSLQFYYVIISIYGWINWKTIKNDSNVELNIIRITKKDIIISIFATVIIYFMYYLVLAKYTDSIIPKSDALVGALSIIGTWMLAKKYIENWLVWIVADSLCIGIYAFKGLYPTVILFVIYTLMAYIGYKKWK